jgi:hypothetical protein
MPSIESEPPYIQTIKKKIPPRELYSQLYNEYPAMGGLQSRMAIVKPDWVLDECPKAYHVTTSDAIKPDLTLHPESHTNSTEFERITGKLSLSVLTAFRLPSELSHASEKPVSHAEVRNACFLANTVSKNLIEMSRDYAFMRQTNAVDFAFAATALAYFVHQSLPKDTSRKSAVDLVIAPSEHLHEATSLEEYVQIALFPLGEKTIRTLIHKHGIDSASPGQQIINLLHVFGLAGDWAKSIEKLINHRDNMEEHYRPDDRVEGDLLRIAQDIPYTFWSQHPVSLGYRVPVILEFNPKDILPTLQTPNGGKIPYALYLGRPPSILTVPSIPPKAKRIWIDAEDEESFREFVFMATHNGFTWYDRPTNEENQTYHYPILMVNNYPNAAIRTPINVFSDANPQNPPTIDHCSMRYGDPKVSFRETLRLLETGQLAFVSKTSNQFREEMYRKYAEELGIRLKKRQINLFGKSIFD